MQRLGVACPQVSANFVRRLSATRVRQHGASAQSVTSLGAKLFAADFHFNVEWWLSAGQPTYVVQKHPGVARGGGGGFKERPFQAQRIILIDPFTIDKMLEARGYAASGFTVEVYGRESSVWEEGRQPPKSLAEGAKHACRLQSLKALTQGQSSLSSFKLPKPRKLSRSPSKLGPQAKDEPGGFVLYLHAKTWRGEAAAGAEMRTRQKPKKIHLVHEMDPNGCSGAPCHRLERS